MCTLFTAVLSDCACEPNGERNVESPQQQKRKNRILELIKAEKITEIPTKLAHSFNKCRAWESIVLVLFIPANDDGGGGGGCDGS